MPLKKIINSTFIKVLILLLTFVCSACNPIYVTRAAYQEAKILWGRQDIRQILNEANIDDEQAFKLQLVLDARVYAEDLGLKTKKAYATYSEIDATVLSWIVMAARPYAFEMATWWFPIVGSVPYRGFFDKNEADEFAKQLEKAGYETWVRPTDAFSTLGWFNDPLLSTTMRYPAHAVVNTVLHELFHNNIWFKNQVVLNESAANFFAQHATARFFELQASATNLKGKKQGFITNISIAQQAAQEDLLAELTLAQAIEQLYQGLEQLYQDNTKTQAQILAERQQVFDEHVAEFRKNFPKSKALKTINNAEIMQLRTYLTGYGEFKSLLDQCNSDLTCWLKKIAKHDKHL